MQTCKVLGLPLAVTDYASAATWCIQAAQKGGKVVAVSAANTHLATLARHDAKFGRSMQAFDLNCPDGMPLVWAMNKILGDGEKLRDRVYGPTLMLEVLRRSENFTGIRHFFLGGKQTTLDKLVGIFNQDYPQTEIVGTYAPPFGTWSEEENQRIFERIIESKANVVWVGLGCPKQENWIANNKSHMPNAVYFGIGAAFAFHAGEVSQAPKWIQDRGFEWLFRLCAEPKRLFKRYLKYNSLFLWYLAKDSLRVK